MSGRALDVKLDIDTADEAIYWNESHCITFKTFEDIFGFLPTESGTYAVSFELYDEDGS